MEIKSVLQSQYRAALEMLNQAIVKCPDSLWDDAADQNRFWHVAYHALFYTHLYAQPSEEEFVPWTKHQEQYQFMGAVPWPPHDAPEIGKPYSKEEVLEYLGFCRERLADWIASVDLDGASGFDWLPFGKLELQFYNLRHLQHHTGELCERLGVRESLEVDWVGMRRD